MINIEVAENEFKNYTSKYDMNESHLNRKVTHTFRVEKLCERIAISMGLNDEEIKLAKLIGILHDIARFEQYTKYKTFSDHNSFDHGDFGVEILEKDDYIRKYIETDKYDKIIKKAIKNHNKYSIDEGLTEEEMLFCKIIRDADKLDILYQGTCETWKNNIESMQKQIVSEEVLREFLARQTVNKKNINNEIDKIVVFLAFIYDLNFKESYKILKENDYINKILERFNFENENTRTQMEKIRLIANQYIHEKIK